MSPKAARLHSRLEVSFEVFPPKSGADVAMRETVDRLACLGPSFVSVTYGAGGSTQERTVDALADLRKAHPGLPLTGHLTCVGQSREETLSVARRYAELGVTRILALRGDAPEGAGARFVPHPEGFRSAAELVAAIRKELDVEIAVAAYPETHPDASGPEADIDNLKRKLDAGANMAITQFFFENDSYYRFLDAARAAGIAAPIIPGIMPIRNFKGVAGFARKCGTTIPDRMKTRFEAAAERGATRDLALAYAAGQCDALRDQGVSRFHIYTMNSPDLSFDLCRALGVTGMAPQVTSATRAG